MCTGDEDTLLDCLKVDNIGTHDCSHSEDAGVRCEGIAIYGRSHSSSFIL